MEINEHNQQLNTRCYKNIMLSQYTNNIDDRYSEWQIYD